jgi:uncharacterized membrane protein YphA (DoxX/SURF4 family)
VFSAAMKLDDPLLFAQAIDKFGVAVPLPADHWISLAAFVIPWTEMVCGGALILGLWARAAALLLVAALGVFTYALYEVVSSGQAFECGCFGRLKLLCPAKIGWCNIAQNSVLILIGLVPLLGGPGRFSIDRLTIGPTA